MKKIFCILSVISVGIALNLSCSKGGGTTGSGGSGGILDCTTVPKSYATDIDPIIQGFCNTAGCHAAGSSNGPGPLTNYTQVFNARTLIRPQIASGAMPQGNTLTAAQKNSFLCWIDSGGPNN